MTDIYKKGKEKKNHNDKKLMSVFNLRFKNTIKKLSM